MAPSDWLARPGQALVQHLTNVAENAKRFGGAWAGPWAELAGCWHDFGKFSAEFQRYIEAAAGGEKARRGSVNHTSAGAIHAMRRLRAAGLEPEAWQNLAAVILAHHGKLHDFARFEERLGCDEDGNVISPEAALEAESHYGRALTGNPPDWIVDLPLPRTSPCGWPPLFTRMLFSALVDSDRTDAASSTPRNLPPIPVLAERFHAHMAGIMGNAVGAASPINSLRAQVLQECLRGASLPPGVFALDAPTGFGKTLASLGIALEHAKQHGLDRIIYVAPFLTAIEQTAQVFRDALQDADRTLVLEHHSNADRDIKTLMDEVDDEGRYVRPDPEVLLEERMQQRENWDARVVVTSNVQFLESLHAHDARRCRKLHRIARSVVLIDEPQAIPTTFMAPVARTMRELCEHYGTSLVLVTATQPAFGRTRRFVHGLPAIRPLIPPPLLAHMRQIASTRVTVTLPDWERAETWAEIAARLARYDHASLAIVNTKAHARELYRSVRAKGVPLAYHLSAGMCIAHRKVVLDGIKARLSADEPVKVVSTQVIEAGIDIDFPHVMRAMAGLDSIIQAAGRCNRHGSRPEAGSFEIFTPEGTIPRAFAHIEGITRTLLRQGRSIFDPATIAEFYRLIVDETDTDRRRIIKAQDRRNFTQAGTDFRLIDPTTTIVVPYGADGSATIETLNQVAEGRAETDLFDAVQQYCVSVGRGSSARMAASGAIRDLGRFGLWIAAPHAYDAEVGLLGADDIMLSDPASLIF